MEMSNYFKGMGHRSFLKWNEPDNRNGKFLHNTGYPKKGTED
jgi:hypothetical protein